MREGLNFRAEARDSQLTSDKLQDFNLKWSKIMVSEVEANTQSDTFYFESLCKKITKNIVFRPAITSEQPAKICEWRLRIHV